MRAEYLKKNMPIILILAFIISIITIIFNWTWVACIIYGCVAIYFLIKNNEYTIIAFLTMAVFQNIILIIFADNISPTYNTIISLIKEFLLYGATVVGIILYVKQNGIKLLFKRYKWILVFILLFIAIVFKNIIVSNAQTMSVLVALRQMGLPFACFFCGYFLTVKTDTMKKIIRYLVIIASVLTVIGIADMILPDNALWNILDYGQYLQNKQDGIVSLYKGVTRNFYTWDLGFMMRRLVSITGDPLATAHLVCIGFMAFICFRYDFVKKHHFSKAYIVTFVLLLAGCILGFSKGTVVYIMILAAALLYDRYYDKLNRTMIMAVIGVMLVILTVFIVLSYVNADKPTAITNHINGLLSGLGNATLWGNGIGTSGAVNSAITGAAIDSAESYFGVVLSQIGWYGIVIIASLWFRLLIKNFQGYLLYRSKEQLFSMILIIGLSIDMLLSESSVSITGTGIYFIIIGILYKRNSWKEIGYE